PAPEGRRQGHAPSGRSGDRSACRVSLALRLVAATLALMLGACSPNAPQNAAAPPPCPALPAQDYVWVPPATVTIGEDSALRPEEGPARQATVAGFWIAAHEVTNAEFAAFVRATHYQSLAERDPPVLPGAPSEMAQPGSAVFTAPDAANPMWWRWVVGASWHHPHGPTNSSIAGKDRHPVVQIGYADALAYAHWAGKALPSEEQWESAARQGGADPSEPVDAAGNPTANYYQGAFPSRDLALDGYRGTAPVGCFAASRIGTYDMIGNVWEWTRDATRPGADSPVSLQNVIKGGSYLCASNYCARYRPAARQFQERSLGTDHIGFRLIDPNRPPPSASPPP
ncbi:MAG: SUMF1/EgtB/PvdO family nonheme iron enzyme, partial [Sphingopyxis sp.]